MNVLYYSILFPDVASCRNKWKECRNIQRVICHRCTYQLHYCKEDKENYERKGCVNYQILKANTVELGSRLSLRNWFVVIHFASTKKSFLACEFQYQLGSSAYNLKFEVSYKFLQAIYARDARHQLSNVNEFDEDFFSIEKIVEKNDKPLKHRCCSRKRREALIMTKIFPVNNSRPIEDKKPLTILQIKMFLLEYLRSKTIETIIIEAINNQSIIDCNNSTTYKKFKHLIRVHRPTAIPNKEVGMLLPFVHISINNVKLMLLKIFHIIKLIFQQSYPNVFCNKFNRKYCRENLFFRLIFIVPTYKNQFYHSFE